MPIPAKMYFISNTASPTVGSDSQDGFDMFGLGSTGDTWTHATLTFTKSTHGLTPAAGDIFYVSSASAGNAGWYTVASFTDNTIVMTALVSGVDIGSDQTDIVTSDGPWLTLDKWMNTATTAGSKCWMKGGTDYVSDPVAGIDSAGSRITPNVLEGFGTVPGDNTRAVLDGNSDTTFGITLSGASGSLYTVFKNLEMHSFTTDGVELGAADITLWINCISHDNTTAGFSGDRNHKFIRCEAYNNVDGFTFDLGNWNFMCSSHDNSGWGWKDVAGGTNWRYKCLAYQNGLGSILDSGALPGGVLDCTLDGNNDADSIAVRFTNTSASHGFVFNTIIYDHLRGIQTNTNIGEQYHEDFNLFESNSDQDRWTWDPIGENSVTGAPNFGAEGSDYKLGSGSAAIEAGGDGGEVQDGASFADIGAIQREDVAGGGGGDIVIAPVVVIR